jgi:predicted nucleic acid-binding protein
MLKIYLDTCCYSRPFDDLTQSKILSEAQAVQDVVELSKSGELTIMSSQFVKYEIDSIPLIEKRDKVGGFYHYDEYHLLTDKLGRLAKYYQTFGMKTFDSLHLATAETNGADFLLTTDSDFIKFALRCSHNVKVVNPRDFVKEVTDNAT